MVRQFGAAVAATGRAARKQAAVRHPDLIVLDLGLPDRNGLDVIHGLRGWTTIGDPGAVRAVGSRDRSGPVRSALIVGALDAPEAFRLPPARTVILGSGIEI
ncbi:MAG TPA: hypothetical protein VHV82_18610 [Sporichthyaceae bacterium]|jgi:DNA-binding response OmpR family regulator|nr:hypothetical protein [Sporichthyaceae bacterium]